MFLAEVAGDNHAQRITVAIRQWNTVHLVSEQRARLHRFLQRDSVGVIIDTVQPDARGAGQHAGLIQQIAQRKTFPNGIADQARVQTIADAHERGFLGGWFESH